MTGHRVLLVDDEESFVKALAKRLVARGLDVETVSDGEQALDMAKGRTFDIIVLDLAMPGMNGIETLKRLRESDPDLQIILLTGHGTLQTGVEAMKLGAMDVLQKPADLDDLLNHIREAGARRADLIAKKAEGQITDVVKKKGW